MGVRVKDSDDGATERTGGWDRAVPLREDSGRDRQEGPGCYHDVEGDNRDRQTD